VLGILEFNFSLRSNATVQYKGKCRLWAALPNTEAAFRCHFRQRSGAMLTQPLQCR